MYILASFSKYISAWCRYIVKPRKKANIFCRFLPQNGLLWTDHVVNKLPIAVLLYIVYV